MEVGRAAAEVRLEPKDVRRVFVLGPVPLRDGAEDLVRLLIILARRHVGVDRGWQRVVDDSLETIGDDGVAGDADQMLERERELDDRAELDTLAGIARREPLVAGKHA